MKKSILISILALTGASIHFESDAQRRIGIEPEDPAVVIYAVGATDNNLGVYTLSASGSYSATKISGTTYIQYSFANSGGTFVSEEAVYGTKDAGFSIYAGMATAQGGSDGAWSHLKWDYRKASTPYTWEIVAFDMTYNPVDGKIYGSFKGDQYGYSSRLCIYDGDEATVTPVGSSSSTIITAIAADKDGQLWGIAGGTGTLYKIDSKTGDMESVGSVGVSSMYGLNQSAAIDPASGKMYWGAANSFSAFLYEVDLAEVTATSVYSFPIGQRFNAFFIPGPEAPKTAPANVENLAAAFTGTGTDVRVEFTAPALTVGGDDLSGELSYTIEVDGMTPVTGTIEAGHIVTETLTMTEGSHSVSVFCSNANGDGPKSSVQVYAGFDFPDCVTNLSAASTGNNVTLTWEAPAGASGGIVDMSKVSYTVTRNPGAETVASGLTDTEFIDEIPEGPIAEYTYTVTVFYDGQEGKSIESAPLMIGSPYTIPYSQDFENATSLSDIAFKAINPDAGTYAWELTEADGNRFVQIKGGYYTNRGDYLFVAPIEFTGGREYTLKFKMANSSNSDNINLQIFLSRSQSSNTADFITPYIQNNYQAGGSAETQNVFVSHEMTFTVEETGVYCLGFRDIGYYFYSNDISIDDIEITCAADPTPAAVTHLTATAGGDSRRDITIEFTTPATTVSGDALESLDKVEIFRGEELIATLTDDLDTDKQMSAVDTEAPRGENTYTVIAYSGGLASEPVSAKAYSGYADNLVIAAVTAPGNIPVDGEGKIEVTLLNDACNTAGDYTVVLLCDDTEVDRIAGEALEADMHSTYSFTIKWTAQSPQTAVYKVRVDYDADENPADNLSDGYTVEFTRASGISDCSRQGIRVTAANGVLTVHGAAGLDAAVFTADGRLADSAHITGDTHHIALTRGVYVVHVGSVSYKVIL